MRLPLMIVRAAAIAAAVAALAGPLVVTSSRRGAWNERTVRALVVDIAAITDDPIAAREERTRIVQQETQSAFRATTIEAARLGDAMRQAVTWLDTAPPGRREIVCVSPFPIGSLAAEHVAAVPADVGLRLIRAGRFPDTRRIATRVVMTMPTAADEEEGAIAIRVPLVTLTRADTLLHEVVEDPINSVPLEIVSSAEANAAVDAVVAAVIAERVPLPAPGRGARLVLASGAVPVTTPSAVGQRWIADAIVRLMRDRDLVRAAFHHAAGLAAPYQLPPWLPIAGASNGQTLIAAAQLAPQTLVVASAAPAADVVTARLLRSLFHTLAPDAAYQTAEIVPMADAQLRRWERAPGPAPDAGVRQTDEDDRRWLWAVALALLALEFAISVASGMGRTSTPAMNILGYTLRFAAVGIAVASLIDPAFTTDGHIKPRVALIVQDGPSMELPGPGGQPRRDVAERIRQRLTAALQPSFDVVPRQDNDATVNVLIGDRYPDPGSPSDVASGFRWIDQALVSIDVSSALAPNVRIVDVDVPRDIPPGTAIPIAVLVEGAGVVGRTSAVIARVGGVEAGRLSHEWRGPRERWRGAFDVLPAGSPPFVVRIEAQPFAEEATPLDNAADAVVDLRAPIAVPRTAGASAAVSGTSRTSGPAVLPLVDIAISPTALAPAERADLLVRVRPTIAANGELADVVVNAAVAGGEPIRLWPDVERGAFRGMFTAPSSTGASSVRVQVGGARAVAASRAFVVASDVRRVLDEDSHAALPMLAASHRGIAVAPDDLGAVEDFVRRTTVPQTTTVVWRPMRPVWWIVPFAGCLAGEWWLRRRRGRQ